MIEKILFVDDDIEILQSFKRQFYKEDFEILTSNGAYSGLELLKTERDIAIIISDYSMPEIDGITFLKKVKEINPQIIRIMLTGYADLKTAIDAVNYGHVFRFLTKPATKEVLQLTIMEGLRQYRLEAAEKQLLEDTLNGSISLLSEILSLVNPELFSKATRIKKVIRLLVKKLEIKNGWQYEIAAALSQIGYVSTPPIVWDKYSQGKNLSTSEQEMIQRHPLVAQRLLEKIPRLEVIAQMIAIQNKAYNQYSPDTIESEISIGGQLLKVVIDYDDLLQRGLSEEKSQDYLLKQVGIYNPNFLSALGDKSVVWSGWERKLVLVKQLEIGMVLNNDVYSKNDILLVRRGQDISLAVLEKIINYHERLGVKQPIEVLISKPNPV